MNIYNVTCKKGIIFQNLELNDLPTELTHALTVLVMLPENECKIILPPKPGVRTMLLKQLP